MNYGNDFAASVFNIPLNQRFIVYFRYFLDLYTSVYLSLNLNRYSRYIPHKFPKGSYYTTVY